MSLEKPITLDRALNVAMQLTREQQEMLIQTLRNRQIEQRREEIAANAAEALHAFHEGELIDETADELIARLHMSLNNPDE